MQFYVGAKLATRRRDWRHETPKAERQLAETAIVQVRDDEVLNPDSAAGIKRKKWQGHI